MKLKIAVCVTLAVLLQTNLRLVWSPLVFLDLPLVVITYFALRRDVVQALFVGFVAGLATDVFSRGLLGANGFSKTLIAYLIAALVTRVMLDNPLARIPVLAGAAAFDAVVLVFLHRLLGQPSLVSFAETMAYKIIATTIAGTFIFYMFDIFSATAGASVAILPSVAVPRAVVWSDGKTAVPSDELTCGTGSRLNVS